VQHLLIENDRLSFFKTAGRQKREEKEKERKARRVSRFYSTPHETTATKICKGPVLFGTVVLPMENKR
jgi:hypothetical protein